jgi:uncharacterized protein involved in exopolysaccharide biosynthesis
MSFEAQQDQPGVAGEMSGEIDIGRLVVAILERWQIVASAVAAFLLLGILYLHLTQPLYTATLQVTPVQGEQQASSSSSLSGLASLAGINLPSSRGEQSFAIYIDGLTSRLAAQMLFRDQDLMHRLFAREWNPATGQWKARSSVLHGAANSVRWILGISTTRAESPDPARLQRYIQENLTTAKEKESPITTIAMRANSPELSRDLLMGLHRTVDDILRQRALERSTNYITYLTNTLQTTTVAEYRQALIESLSGQTKTRMMASANLPFVAEPFGAPVTSDVPTSPNGVITLGLMLVLGIFAGVGLALWQDWRGHRRPAIAPESSVAPAWR